MSLRQTQCAWGCISRPADFSECYLIRSLWSQGQDQNQTRLRNRNPDGTQVTQRRKDVREMVHSNLLWSIYWGQIVYSTPLKDGDQDIYVGHFISKEGGSGPNPISSTSPSLGPKARCFYGPHRWNLVIDVMLMVTIGMLAWTLRRLQVLAWRGEARRGIRSE